MSTGQENAPSAIFADGKEDAAIYYVSLGRYKQSAGITGTDNFGGNATGTVNGRDSLGKIAGIEPKDSTVLDSTFTGNRFVYNVLRYAGYETLKYVGPNGFLCSVAIGNIKDRITGKTYHQLITAAITSEGFTNISAGTTGGSLDGAGLTSSYCRVTNGTSAGAPDTVAPTVGVKSGATFTGLASATFEYSKPVRTFDSSKVSVTNSEGTVLTAADYTITCFNQRSAVVASCTTGTNETDPYQITAIKSFTVALKSSITGTVSYAVAAGSAKSLAAVNATAGSASTTADVTAPVATVVSSTHSGLATITYNFGEPVRIDATKFSAEGTVATNTTPISGVLGTVVSGSQAVTLTYLDANNNVVNYTAGTPAGDQFQARVANKVRVTVNASANSVIFTAAAGAATDLSGFASAAVTTKPSAVADFGAGVGNKGAFAANDAEAATSKTKTYTVKGTSISITLTGASSITVDGVVVYNVATKTHYDAVPAVGKTAAKAATDVYTTPFGAGTFTLDATTPKAAGSSTTRVPALTLGNTFSGAVGDWHKVVVKTLAGGAGVTALSGS